MYDLCLARYYEVQEAFQVSQHPLLSLHKNEYKQGWSNVKEPEKGKGKPEHQQGQQS